MANAEPTYRILVVDDDEVERRVCVRLLAQQPRGQCSIHQAYDGTTGLAALRSHSFDCVLLDYSLPDMTGVEFLASAAAPDGGLPCAVMLITGRGDEATAVAAMKSGAQDYLVKGRLDADSLWRAMTRAIAQVELKRGLAASMRNLQAANAALEREIAARHEANAANRAKTEFVAMVTHELRTPLNGILGYGQLLHIEGGLTPRQQERVDAMTRAGRHLLGMIERVLDFASIESGRIVLAPEPIALHEMCDGCLASIAPAASARGLTVRAVATPDAPSRMLADPGRLRQILLNLLGNAVKFTTAGSIELRALPGQAPGQVLFEVADTGPGIEEALRGRLFRDFERLGQTTIEGAGLGLAITARMTALMGGTIGYRPNSGGGSIFWLELPTGEPVRKTPSLATNDSTTGNGRNVLLVDDTAMNRDVLAAFLRVAGHRTEEAESGEEAIRLARERRFDLILMDIRMPHMDGLEATRHIRSLPDPHGRVPILAVTASAVRDMEAQCRDAGMDGFLSKPVDYATLMRAVA